MTSQPFTGLKKKKNLSPHFHIQTDKPSSVRSDINVNFKNTATQCCQLDAIIDYFTLQYNAAIQVNTNQMSNLMSKFLPKINMDKTRKTL